MLCLGFEPGATGWQAKTNPLSYLCPYTGIKPREATMKVPLKTDSYFSYICLFIYNIGHRLIRNGVLGSLRGDLSSDT